MSLKSNKSVLTGVMITSGCAIGAGMFSLPVVSSGMWFLPSIICLVALWFLSYLSSIYILEANVKFSPGASFDTIVSNLLGKTWNTLTGLSVAFLLYILLYAYFSAFGNIAVHTLGEELFKNSSWSQGVMSLLLGGILAFVVWLSTSFVGRVSTILVSGMVITFIVSMSGLALNVEVVKLFNITEQNSSYAPFIWAALPYFVTAFGFASVVPSLYKYYGNNPITIKKGLLYGSLIALLVYILFILVSFGNISRHEFIVINEAGGNMGDLVGALEGGKSNSISNIALNVFSNFAIISSFLAVGLSLFDYVADKFSFADNAKGRFYSACITFLPTGIASFFFPNGFIAAIGFAGLVSLFGFHLVPFLMVNKVRNSVDNGSYRVFGGKPLLYAFLIISLLVGVCQVLAMLDYLPKW